MTSSSNTAAPPCPKAYSYSRFSTPEQADGDSLRRQTEAARDYAARHNLALDEELTFHDPGMSAYHGLNAEAGALGRSSKLCGAKQFRRVLTCWSKAWTA